MQSKQFSLFLFFLDCKDTCFSWKLQVFPLISSYRFISNFCRKSVVTCHPCLKSFHVENKSVSMIARFFSI